MANQWVYRRPWTDYRRRDPRVILGGFTITAVLTGTAEPSATEAEIVTGGETTIITLTNDTWLATGGSFNGQRQAIIDGFDAATSPTNGWNNEVRDNEVVGSVARTSDTIVTITWSAAGSYSVASNETITGTIPASALVTSGVDITATPTFAIIADAAGLSIPVAMYSYRRHRAA